MMNTLLFLWKISTFMYLQVFPIPVALADFYPSTVKDHIVTKRVYQSIETQDWLHCLVTCQSDAECSSYNFKLDENEAGNNCELSKCGGEKETTLISRQGFVFQQLRAEKENHLCRKQTKQKPTPPSDGLESSSILKTRQDKYLIALRQYLGPANHSWKRCYHSAAPGFNQTAFHHHCDTKGPTVTIVRVNQFIFGGYIEKSWKSEGHCPAVSSQRAFLFSLYNKYGFKPHKFNIRPGVSNCAHAAWHCSKFGPAFGQGFDLILYPTIPSFARPLSYDTPPECNPSPEMCIFYTGTSTFWPSEVEVFYQNDLYPHKLPA